MRPIQLTPLLLPLALMACREAVDTVDEAAEVVAEAGAERLHDPLRAAQGPPRVLIFALDGVGHEALLRALEGGALPTLAALLGAGGEPGTWQHGVSAGPVLTVLPSITLAAWTTLFTGATPGETGVPGNEWFDRDRDLFHAPAPVSVTPKSDALATLSDQMMDSLVAVPTLFEQADVRSYVALLPVQRGADILALPDRGGLTGLLTSFVEGVVGPERVEREVYAAVDRASAERMADLVEDDGAPDLGVVYFPGIDLYTHAAASPLNEQQRYLAEVTEGAMAEVLEAYREAGALVGTWVIVTGDHGHTPVPHDEVHALGGDSAFSAQTVLESAGYRVREPALEEEADDYQAVMAWQGAFAYVSLADRSTCAEDGAACAWERPARWEEDVLPAGRALARAAADHPSGPLDLVLLRQRSAGSDAAATLLVLEGEEAVPLDSYLARNPRPELLRFAERLRWLTSGAQGDHAGDVILMTRMGASVPFAERHYFSKPYHSWHASAEAQDSHAPLLVARVDLTAAQVREALARSWPEAPTQLDFTPLVLRLLRAR